MSTSTTTVRREHGEEALHRLILCYDVQESAKLTNPAKLAVRELLAECRDVALTAAAVPAESVNVKDLGDGALMLFDAQVPKVRVLGTWLDAFHDRLQRGYERSVDRCQVRLAIHAGEVTPSLGDHSGADLDFTARLVDAPIAKQVLARTPSAALAVVVSELVYYQVVRHGAPSINPAGYSAVTVRVKETDASAWLHLPGWARVPLPPEATGAPSAGPVSGAEAPERISVTGNVGIIGTTTGAGPFNFYGPSGGDR